MRTFVPLTALLLSLLVSCNGASATATATVQTATITNVEIASMDEIVKPTNLSDQFSYVYGYEIAKGVSSDFDDVNLAYVLRGVYDAMQGTSFFTSAESDTILIDYRTKVLQETTEKLRAQSAENTAAAEAFLATNKLRTGVVEVSDKLQYEVLREGNSNGKTPTAASNVTVDYQLMLLNGEFMDSSYERGASSSFTLSSTIQGFRDMICLMKEGEKVRVWIHPDLGYGTYGNGTIGPGQLLIFDIELISVNS